MKKEKLKKALAFLENRKQQLSTYKVENAISDDARAEIEGRIAELQSIIDDLKDLEVSTSDGTDDKTDEMRAQMAEIMEKIKKLSDGGADNGNVQNSIKRFTSSKQSAIDFLEVVRNSATSADFKTNWREYLNKKSIVNGIDTASVAEFLPAAIVNEINDAFVGRRHRLLELVDWTGLPVFKALWETGNEGAKMHTRGQQKEQQKLTFEKIEIRPQYVYKLLAIDKELEKESAASGDVLISYITRELLDRLLATIENYILTAPAGGSFIAPKQVTVTNEMMEAYAYMEDTDGAIAIMSPSVYAQTKAQLRTELNRMILHEDVLAYFGVEEIVFNKSTFTPTSGTWTGVWFMRPQDYKLVGDRRPDEYTDFNLEYNKLEYLTEMWIGGGCVVPNNFIALVTE